MPLRQEWYCEGCGLHGVTETPLSVDVMTAVELIRSHHDRLAEKYAPDCAFDTRKVRVRNPDKMTIYQWNKAVHENEQKKRKATA